jgi:hypothetical protein
MKTIIRYAAMIILAVAGTSCATTYSSGYSSSQVQVGASVSFYDALSPYGRWVDYPGYNQVWIPNAGGDFQPYYNNGHWVYTDYGWTWQSDYPWGWAAFHYGRWFYDNNYGWAWVPGDEWGPGWVDWRSGGDYYGWAPMGPNVSIGINIGIGIPANRWTFVDRRYITSPYLNRYYVDRGRNNIIINNTTVINNITVINNRKYYRGPDVREVERVTNNRITPIRVANTTQPGPSRVQNNQFRVFRPDESAIRRDLTNRVNNNKGNNTNTPNRVFNNNNNNNATPGNRVNGNNNNAGQPNTPGRVFNNNNNNNQPSRDGNRVPPAGTINPGTTPNRVNPPADNRNPGNNPVVNPGANTPGRTFPSRQPERVPTTPQARPAQPAQPSQPQRVAPPQRSFTPGTQQNRTPVQRTAPTQQRAPVQRAAPQRSAPVQQRVAPQRSAPVQRVAPQRSAPVQRAAPARSAPERTRE